LDLENLFCLFGEEENTVVSFAFRLAGRKNDERVFEVNMPSFNCACPSGKAAISMTVASEKHREDDQAPSCA
jgi:hypothetical protein